MSKRKRKRRSASQKILWAMSLIIVGSMVISLVFVALPSRPPASTRAHPYSGDLAYDHACCTANDGSSHACPIAIAHWASHRP